MYIFSPVSAVIFTAYIIVKMWRLYKRVSGGLSADLLHQRAPAMDDQCEEEMSSDLSNKIDQFGCIQNFVTYSAPQCRPVRQKFEHIFIPGPVKLGLCAG